LPAGDGTMAAMSANTLDTPPPMSALMVMGRPLTIAEVDISQVSTTRCVAALIITDDRIMPVGALTFDAKRGSVEVVHVGPQFRRKGIATALWDGARQLCPELAHSGERSPAGTAWANAVGGPVPRLRKRLTEQEGVAYGSRLITALFGLSPADLITVVRAADAA
jgi:hypothetical protein